MMNGNRSLGAHLLRAVICLIVVLFSSGTIRAAQWMGDSKGAQVTVAVVQDGPGESLDDLSLRFENAFRTLTRGEISINFKSGPNFSADWDQARAGKVLDAALRDKTVDLVLANGPLVSTRAFQVSGTLSKPVVGVFSFDPSLILPGTPGNPRKLVLVVIPDQVRSDMATMAEMFGGVPVTVLVDSVLLDRFPNLKDALIDEAKSANMQAQVLPMAATAHETVESIGEDAKLVYLTPRLRMSSEQNMAMIKALNERKVRIFSGAGIADVQEGALAGQLPGVSEPLARSAALNLAKLAQGKGPGKSIVDVSVQRKLTINEEAAAAEDYEISLKVASDAMEVGEEAGNVPPDGSPALTCSGAVSLALKNNAMLASNQAQVEEARQDRNKAVTHMLPQVQGGFLYLQLDSHISSDLYDILPKNSVYGGVSVSQMIFSDPVISGFRAENRNLASQEFEHEAMRLDIAAETERFYLDCLATAAQVRVAENSLALTRRNLTRAQERRQVGTAGPQEVYRWQAKEADASARLSGAHTLHESKVFALNQVMNENQNMRWTFEDRSPADLAGPFNETEFHRIVLNPGDFDALQQWVVQTAQEASPELKSIDALLSATKIEKGLAVRRFFLPEMGLGFLYFHCLDRTAPQLQNMPQLGNVAFPMEKEDHYLLSLLAAWPLFEGGGKIVDLKKAGATLQRMESLRKSVSQKIELNARDALLLARNARKDMEYARKASEAASKNLEVVSRAYSQGLASILDQLDAQDTEVYQKQGLVISEYNYLKAIVDVNRVTGRIDVLTPPENEAAWNKTFEQRLEHIERGESHEVESP